VLELHHLSRAGHYGDIDITFHAGEVVGLTGLEGSGPGSLVRGLFGLEDMGTGEARIDGKRYVADTPIAALRQRLAYLPRDRHGLGIIGSRSVKDNITLSVLRKIQNALGLIDTTKESALVGGYIKRPRHKDSIPRNACRESERRQSAEGRRRQARGHRAAVLFLDEPTQASMSRPRSRSCASSMT